MEIFSHDGKKADSILMFTWGNPGETSFLHWSAVGEPWVRLDAGRPCPVDALWAPYDTFLRKSLAVSS